MDESVSRIEGVKAALCSVLAEAVGGVVDIAAVDARLKDVSE